MRTNIEIDDELMERALHLTGLRTKREAVHEALRRLVDEAEEAARHRKLVDDFDALRGIGWDGDLDAWRRSE